MYSTHLSWNFRPESWLGRGDGGWGHSVRGPRGRGCDLKFLLRVGVGVEMADGVTVYVDHVGVGVT